MKKEHEDFAQELLNVSTAKLFAPTNRYVNTAVMMDLPALYDFVIEKGSSKRVDNSVAEEQYQKVLDLINPNLNEQLPSNMHAKLKAILNYKEI